MKNETISTKKPLDLPQDSASGSKMPFIRQVFSLRNIRQAGVLIILAGMIITFSLLLPNFFTVRNLMNLTRQFSMIFLVGIGFTFVMLSGEIDLSVGSIVGISTVVLAMLMRATGDNILVSIVLTLLLGGVVGLINGFLVT